MQMPPPLVGVAVAEQGPIEQVVRLIGQSAAVDGVTLTTKAAGIIAAIEFQNGAEVQAGQVLVRLDSAREEAQVRQAQGERDLVQAELANRLPLLEQGLVRPDEITRLKAGLEAREGGLASARAALSERTVVAPFSGRIGIRRVSVGALVTPGTAIAPLVKEDPVQVEFSVPETAIAGLKPGLVVRATTPAWPGRVFTGAVTAVDPQASETTRSVGAIAIIPNPDRALRPGLALTVELVVQRIADAVRVPEGALVRQGDAAFVWVVADAGKGAVARRVPVQTGVRSPGQVQIVSGVAAGAQVVVEGLQRVRDGAPVRLPEAGPEAAKP
jgi:membrane fusion protein (multidrug efflux system)